MKKVVSFQLFEYVGSRQGTPDLCSSVDIWALGVLLYKLCYYTTPLSIRHIATPLVVPVTNVPVSFTARNTALLPSSTSNTAFLHSRFIPTE